MDAFLNSLFIGIVIAFGLGWLIKGIKDKKDRREGAKRLIISGKIHLNEKRPMEALYCLLEAKGLFDQHQTSNLIGCAFEALELWDLAAESYHEARWSIRNASSFTVTTYKEPDAGWMAYYYYKQAIAYTKYEYWEFAYLRANDGIELIELRKIPRYFQDTDIETELRLIHIISALHHLDSAEALKVARADSFWIVKYSEKQDYKKLARIVLKQHDISKIDFDAIVHGLWKYDISYS